LSIEEIPPYEDIFFNLKDKVAQYEQLQQKLLASEQKYEETIATLKQNEELLKEKKL